MFKLVSITRNWFQARKRKTGRANPCDALCGCGHPKDEHPDGLDCLHIGRDWFDGCPQRCRVFVEMRKCA